MKTITRLLATAALLFGVVGGVTSVKAKKVFANLQNATETWTSSTNTFSWKHTGNNFIATGLPKGDISSYTNFHCIVSDFSENANFIRLVVKNDKDTQITEYINAGEFNINLVSKYPSWDFTCVTDILIFGSNSATEGHSINENNPASVVIRDVYLEKPDAPFVSTVSNSFGDEITSLDYITDGTRFAIGNGSNAKYWATASSDNQNTSILSIPSDAYYYYKLEKVEGLDTDGDENVENDNYRILIVNSSNEAVTGGYNFGPYMNYSQYGQLFAATARAKEGSDTYTYGQDGNYYAIWKVAYSAGNGFTIKNAGINKYATVTGSSDDVTYLKLYKSINFTSTTMQPANDEIFALSKATGYNAESGVMTNGTWTFETPVDISNWDYLMITTSNTASDGSHEITITDNNGVSVHGEDYKGSAAGTGGNMWLDRWNNQNAIRISIDYLKNTMGMDVEKIKSLSIGGTIKIANVYLTDYNNIKISGGYKDGDVKRPYSETGKYGTICLPYKASYAGAEVYSIAGKDGSKITLTKVNGLLEAGKPYFYMSADENGQDNARTVRNVNFFRADFDEYDSEQPISNNGLIGTFSDMTAPAGSNYWILSGNKLYDTEGCTGDDAVTVGANKAYINTSLIVNALSASRSAFIFFDEATGIKAVQGNVTAKQEGIFNLNGQRLNQLKKGLNIVNGKKVMVK